MAGLELESRNPVAQLLDEHAGEVPVEALLAATLDAGYDRPFDLELIGPRIEAEGYRTAVARGVEAVTGMLERLGA